MDTIAQRIDAVRERIEAAARRANRTPGEVRLVAVTKTHPPQVVAEAIAAGAHDLGENRVQEAEPKIATLADAHPDVTWHLIGHLQSNKAKRAAALFSMIQSVDSLRLAQELDRHADGAKGDTETRRQEAGRRLPVLLQVNVSGEASKDGFALFGWPERPAVLDAFLNQVEQILAMPNLHVRGLMTIAPWGDDPAAARPTFRATHTLRGELARRFPAADWSALSMGMTDDFEVAIEEGATLVRVGRAIFGDRT